jgi:hypothetical protein
MDFDVVVLESFDLPPLVSESISIDNMRSTRNTQLCTQKAFNDEYQAQATKLAELVKQFENNNSKPLPYILQKVHTYIQLTSAQANNDFFSFASEAAIVRTLL